jgi:hypothetical protein
MSQTWWSQQVIIIILIVDIAVFMIQHVVVTFDAFNLRHKSVQILLLFKIPFI